MLKVTSVLFYERQHQGITNYTGPEIFFSNTGHLGIGGIILSFEDKRAKIYTGVLYNTLCGVVDKCEIADGDVLFFTIVEFHMHFPLFVVIAETANGLSIPYPRNHL